MSILNYGYLVQWYDINMKLVGTYHFTKAKKEIAETQIKTILGKTDNDIILVEMTDLFTLRKLSLTKENYKRYYEMESV